MVAIIGPRQSGKTTLCHQIEEDWRSFDLEKESDYQLVDRDPELFLRMYPHHVIIDEIQTLPKLFPALRVSIDETREIKGRYIVTGSSSPSLVRNISETLAGRVAIVELGSLKATERWGTSPSEFYPAIAEDIHTQTIENLEPVVSPNKLWESWLYGGYPEPVLHREKSIVPIWMDNYRSTYINRDIRNLFPRLNIEAFRRFIGMLANLSGTIVNFADVSRSLAVSQPSVKDYIDIVDGTFIWRKLPAYIKNTTKRMMKMPRGHIRDSGLLNFLLHINSKEKLLMHPNVGR